MNLELTIRLTHSCYSPNNSGIACGRCDACQLRLQRLCRSGIDGSDCVQSDSDGEFTTDDTEDTESNQSSKIT